MPFDHFGFLAPIYDRVLQFADGGQMITRASLPITGRLLDAGGGTGRVSIGLKAYAGNVVVADLSFAMLRQAASRHLQSVCTYSEKLPFPSDSFERIIMVDALHHLNDQQAAACELWRLLQPGGTLVILEPDIACLAGKLIALFEKAMLMRSHFLPLNKMQDLFKFTGIQGNATRQKCNIWLIFSKK